MKTIHQHLAETIPYGTRCDECPMAFGEGNGDVHCGLLEETMKGGDKDCGINDPRTAYPLAPPDNFEEFADVTVRDGLIAVAVVLAGFALIGFVAWMKWI